jgi:hypothetical protein
MELIQLVSNIFSYLYNIHKLSKYRVNTMILIVLKYMLQNLTRPKWHTEMKLIPMGVELQVFSGMLLGFNVSSSNCFTDSGSGA